MNTSTYKVAISCIGTGVGQSIINSIRTSQLPITTVGFGNNPFAYGAYDCDVMDYLPGIYDANYLNQLIEKCKLHEIDLLIPCLDDEVLLLAQNVDTLKSNGILAIHSDLKIVSICRDKERISYELNNSNLFVRSYNKNSLKNASKKGAIQFPLIAKPKSGYSSNGVKIIRSDDDLHQLTSKDVIQELAIPAKNDPNRIEFDKHLKLGINSQVSEISIQLVFSHESHLLGKMCTNHRLKNGIPIEVVLIDDHRIWGTVNELIPRFQALGVKGPLNLQGRLTDDGLKIFEINPRFTGITGLRALMGFNEVIVCIKNWLGIDSGKYLLEPSHQKFGIRQMSDKSVSIGRNIEVSQYQKKLNEAKIESKKILLITGSTGYLGQNLVNELINQNEHRIFILSTNRSKAESLFNEKAVSIYDINDFQKGEVNLGSIDMIIHLGFTRNNGNHEQIADSLNFTNELFSKAAIFQVPAIINISSQSVYGMKATPPWTEKTPVAPETGYAQAKYATELMLRTAHATYQTLDYCSVRLGTLAGGAMGLAGDDFLSKFCNTAIIGGTIKLIGGQQQIQRLNIMDAVEAIIKVINSNSSTWKPVYNVSSDEILSLKEIAKHVVQIENEENGGMQANIEIENKPSDFQSGMDSTQFKIDMKWRSRYDIKDSIRSLLTYFKSEDT